MKDAIATKGAPRRARGCAAISVLLAVLVLMISSAAAADALAKPTNAVAREHFKTGNRLYNMREFEKAIDQYRSGAAIEDTPVFHYNLGQCYRQLRRYEEALWHYERFLSRGKPTGELEVLAKKFVVDMRTALQEQISSPPPVRSAPVQQPSAADRLGKPALSVRSVEASPVGVTSRRRKLAIGLGIGGAAIVGLGLGIGLSAKSLEDDADEICPMTSCERADEANALIDRGKTRALYANVSLGVGAATIVGAAVLWVVTVRSERRRTAFVPHLSRSFTGVAVSRTF